MPDTTPELVRYETAGGVATLTMNRPEKRNALDVALVTALKERFAEAEADDGVRVVVLAGEGRAFSAGADLAALERLQTATAEANLADSEHLAGLFAQIYHSRKSVVAHVAGHAIAGGCGLAAVCDFALVARGAKLGFTEVRIGFVPAIVGVFLVRKLGEAAARDLLLRGHLIGADEAARLGLVTRACEPEDLAEAVESLAAEVARETSGVAVALTKRLLADLPGMGLSEALRHATNLNALARGTDDCKAGVGAFLRKEAPPWKR
jgi:methylglutaconyl-CoA hydratase